MKKIRSDLNIDLLNWKVSTIEIGFNLLTPNPPDFYARHFLSHKGKAFEKMDIGIGYNCKHQQSLLKVYSKSEQFNLPYHVFRPEFKYLKSCALPITLVLSMLTDINVWHKCFHQIHTEFSDCIVTDDVEEGLMHRKELEIFLRRSNCKHWERGKFCGARPTRTTHLREFNNILHTYGKHHVKEFVLDSMTAKYAELIR